MPVRAVVPVMANYVVDAAAVLFSDPPSLTSTWQRVVWRGRLWPLVFVPAIVDGSPCNVSSIAVFFLLLQMVLTVALWDPYPTDEVSL